ncbi:predicted nucleic acid-binding protein, contains PIN domain [Moorella thermoacetica Y72]|uniref:Predicted nucleic acid-binding protein, contains PIN domain n=1 Tax=Moorella thermoacetica Y72 TaxID=1325331 RepID=A0A0S6UBD6_NEOTH|nr:PIN domain-containing protein [Moorella thermoacetica]GAF26401.1 predicted nucleic acid-binding protein, contains PIN domain [Moorella thermoacetica Y72]
MEKIMVDTSAIYALIDRSDDRHEKAKHLFKKLSEQDVDLILTNFILAETHALILSRIGHELAREWVKNLIWKIERVKEEDEKRAREIIIAYQDKPFSYTDATTFAVMERLKLNVALAFDNHFTQFGWQCFDA